MNTALEKIKTKTRKTMEGYKIRQTASTKKTRLQADNFNLNYAKDSDLKSPVWAYFGGMGNMLAEGGIFGPLKNCRASEFGGSAYKNISW